MGNTEKTTLPKKTKQGVERAPAKKTTPKKATKKATKKVASQEKVIKKRTQMAQNIAMKWVKANVNPEFRFTVYIKGGQIETKKLSNLIKGFRDGNINIRGVIQKRELGIKESFDSITFWSSDLSCIKTLCDWFEGKGHDTTGIWW